MLLRGYQQVLLVGSSLSLLLFIGQYLFRYQGNVVPEGILTGSDSSEETPENVEVTIPDYGGQQEVDTITEPSSGFDPKHTHRVIYSQSTADQKYFKINTLDYLIYNANLLPHPLHNDTWIVVGQRNLRHPSFYFSELYCEAKFVDGEMICIRNPLTLSIANTPADHCQGNQRTWALNIGPHDARAFVGPEFPIIVYGSNSAYTCMGIFAADLRTLMDWEFESFEWHKFRFGTEIQRPPPIDTFEKNYFLFWDTAGNMYAHYNIMPRAFAKIEWDGSASDNLAVAAAPDDDKCMAEHIPRWGLDAASEAIHQATNSLAVTMCHRADPSCVADESNTFIMTIFHHKICLAEHNTYEPYVMLFEQNAPFSIYGFSKKPLWIHGRAGPGEVNPDFEQPYRPIEESEMFYTVSINWKAHGQMYHGYLDDEILLGFGIEDARGAGVDILASDLLQDVVRCKETEVLKS